MNKNQKSRHGLNHLYNPKKEGVGAYDYHYINAYKKNKNLRNKLNKSNEERYVA